MTIDKEEAYAMLLETRAHVADLQAEQLRTNDRLAVLESVQPRRKPVLQAVARSTWAQQFPYALLPADGPGAYDLQTPAAHVAVQLADEPQIREFVPVWGYPNGPDQTPQWNVEHRQRKPSGPTFGWQQQRNPLAYAVRNPGTVLGSSDVDSWKKHDRWDKLITHLRWGGTIAPVANRSGLPAGFPDPTTIEDGAACAWLPMQQINSEIMKVQTVFAIDGELWIGQWGRTPNYTWFRIDLFNNRVLSRDGKDATANFFFGDLVPESEFPQN